MTFRKLILTALLTIIHLCAPRSFGDSAKHPNIVFIFIDDWAWNGSPIAMDDSMANARMPVLRMPNLEKLARDGMKFRNAYASPQCSPSRVWVQTGQSSPRNPATGSLPVNRWRRNSRLMST